MRISILFFFIIIMIGSTLPERHPTAPTPQNRPKNVILIIGNGMGLTQISASLLKSEMPLYLEQFPYTGLHTPHTLNSLASDAAAGATAISTGVKTFSKNIGLDKNEEPVTNLMEMAESRGWASGMVTTGAFSYPGNLAYFAHTRETTLNKQLIKQYLSSGIDLFIGGGISPIPPQLTEELKKGGIKVEGENASIADLRKSGYRKPKVAFTSRPNGFLKEACSYATDFLSKYNKDNGFILVINNPQIEIAGYAAKTDKLITELQALNQAVGAALEFAKKDKETMILVTGDHETGGLAINPGSTKDSLITEFTTSGNTGSMIPVFAYGPGTAVFSGVYDNTDIHHKLVSLLGWE